MPWTKFTSNRSTLPAAWVGDFLPKLLDHQQQGYMDEACGFYCVAMVLQYWEVDINEARGKRALSRYLQALASKPLLSGGLTITQIKKVITFFPFHDFEYILRRSKTWEHDEATIKNWVSEARPSIVLFSFYDAVLDRLAESRGLPQSITMDNGPEFAVTFPHYLGQ